MRAQTLVTILLVASCVTSNRRYRQHHADVATGELAGWDRGQCRCSFREGQVQLGCDDAGDEDDLLLYAFLEPGRVRVATRMEAQVSVPGTLASGFYTGPAVVELGVDTYTDPEKDITAVYRQFYVHTLYLPAAEVCDWQTGSPCTMVEESRLEGGFYPCLDGELTVDDLLDGEP